jgi:hypothetical protein
MLATASAAPQAAAATRGFRAAAIVIHLALLLVAVSVSAQPYIVDNGNRSAITVGGTAGTIARTIVESLASYTRRSRSGLPRTVCCCVLLAHRLMLCQVQHVRV